MHQSIPFITIKFHLDSEKVNENKNPLDTIAYPAAPATKSDCTGSKQHSRKREIIFQTDPNNLLYIINILEKTLTEARTHRVRNIVKNL